LDDASALGLLNSTNRSLRSSCVERPSTRDDDDDDDDDDDACPDARRFVSNASIVAVTPGRGGIVIVTVRGVSHSCNASNALGPLTRTTATPARPGAVASAYTVSRTAAARAIADNAR
jgi:hypothetical protein